MELHARTVTAPDGTVWRVSPQWMARRGPKISSTWRRRWERRTGRRESRRGDSGLDACDCCTDLGDDLVGALFAVVFFVVVGALLIFFVWPLLALAVELLLVALLLVLGFVLRVAFRRPWVVEADARDGRRLEYRIVGYGPMRRCLTEVADGLQYGQAMPQVQGAEAKFLAPRG